MIFKTTIRSHCNSSSFSTASTTGFTSSTTTSVSYTHLDVYKRQTLGLINFRKGSPERGQELYQEAIKLARTAKDKARIRQKLNLELGRFWVDRSDQKARRFLGKVSAENHGETALQKQANALLKTLKRQ